MSETVIVAILSLVGTIAGSLGGILVASKLTNYRLQQLERKVDEHNGFGRLIPVMQEQIKELRADINKLQAEVARLQALHTERRD